METTRQNKMTRWLLEDIAALSFVTATDAQDYPKLQMSSALGQALVTRDVEKYRKLLEQEKP